MLGSMLITFVGFIGALPKDLYFKIIVDAIAILLMIRLGLRIRRQSTNGIGIVQANADLIIPDMEILEKNLTELS